MMINKIIFHQIIFLLLTTLGNTQTNTTAHVWGSEKNVFNKETLRDIALTVSKIDMMALNLKENHDFYCRDSIDITASTHVERNKNWKRVIINNYAGFGYGKNTEFVVDTSEINNFNFWKEKFIVFKCHHIETILNKTDTSIITLTSNQKDFRILAIDYGGVFYYLSGFKKDDFKQLIKSKFGIIKTKNLALKIALFYLQNVEALLEYSYEIIDDSSFVKYQANFKIEKPSITIENDDFHITIYTINHFENIVNIYKIVLSKNGVIKINLID
jgi:hypothetical protein